MAVRPSEAYLDDATDDERVRRRLQAAEHFPDQNPNPVLRMDEAGGLLYANPASASLVRDLGLVVGHPIPHKLLALLREALDHPDAKRVEVEAGRRTFDFKPVASPEFGFVNVYATDVSAARSRRALPGTQSQSGPARLDRRPAALCQRRQRAHRRGSRSASG